MSRKSSQFSWLVIGLVSVVVAPGPVTAQAEHDTFKSDVIELPAGPTGSYTLRVLLPPEHDSTTAGLPVLYYLDAWWWGGLLESLVRIAATASPPRMEPVILVGIAVDGDADDWNRARNRDFTPSPYRPIAPGVQLRTGNIALDSAGTGGARDFLAYFEREIVPAVQRRYKVAERGRGIAGHSYGGLFAAWSLATRPDLFDRFLLISPSMYWNDDEVLGMGVLGGTLSPVPNRVFLGVGGSEWPIMTRSADSLASSLQSLDHTDLEHIRYEGADHLTVLPRALLDGLLYLYER